MDIDSLVAWLDLSLNLVGAFLLMLILMSVDQEKRADADPSVTPGNLIVEMYWPDDNLSDVDLWVKAPGDHPVGYSAKSGRIFDLLRDDLGYVNDQSGKNYETAFTREIPAGEYDINVHLYRQVGALPIPVRVVIRERTSYTRNVLVTIFAGNVELTAANQEITVIRLTLDEKGNIASTSHLPIELRVPLQ